MEMKFVAIEYKCGHIKTGTINTDDWPNVTRGVFNPLTMPESVEDVITDDADCSECQK